MRLHKWALALQLLTSSKKGVSAYQPHRMIKVIYKIAWSMFHRIREGMADPKAPPIRGLLTRGKFWKARPVRLISLTQAHRSAV